jgi:hypothetical protein
MFLDEYKLRKDRGELLYEGRWIKPSDKFDFIEETRREHKALFLDLVILLGIGFLLAIIVVAFMRLYFFPTPA